MENAAVLAKPIPPKEAGRAVRDAAVHWSDWRVVFGHGGDLRDNPILACRIHFGCFLWEFGVGRNVGFQTSQADDDQPPPVLVERAKRLQQRLRSDDVFLAAITSGDARALAACGHSIATTHSAKGSANGLHSLLSKVAALRNPSAFIASDTFARAGLSWLARGTRTSFDPVQSGERRSERSAESVSEKGCGVLRRVFSAPGSSGGLPMQPASAAPPSCPARKIHRRIIAGPFSDTL